ncbi:MAG: DUF547 domain-containing protein [Planctomycetota bacterium]
MNFRRAVAVPLVLACAASLAHGDDRKIDHSDLDALLKKYVDAQGLVDYKTWKAKDTAGLDAYLKKLAETKDEDKLSKNERLAFLINAYNAITIKSVLDRYPTDSIKGKIWTQQDWTVSGKKVSLDDIEHKMLRKMGEPRIHFAIVCASKGCPYLRSGAYTADKIDEQLDEQVAKAFADPGKLKVDRASKTVHATPLFDWFGDDFGASKAQRLTWIAKRLKDPEDRKVALDSDASLKFLDWDWKLNER